MKILFISSAAQPDYLCDSLYHGLKTRFGKDVESANDMWYMYDTLLADEKKYLYGKGFTLYGLLNVAYKNVPAVKDIVNRINSKYYNYIIYGSVYQCKLFLNDVLEHYISDKIIFVDGEDRILIEEDLLKKGLYFKRELVNNQANVYPISFAIPAEKIVTEIPVKTRDWAINYPGKLNTYIHKTEESYYTDYRTSKFAATFKKEGWDCLRHYEILANGCLPYFKDLNDCPSNTIANFPKKLVLDIKAKIEANISFSDEEYNQLAQELVTYTRNNLTTEALADYVLKIAEDNSSAPVTHKYTESPEDKNAAIIKARFIENALDTSKTSATILYFGSSAVQDLRYLQIPGLKIYANSIFKSALNFSVPDSTTLQFFDDDVTPAIKADAIILDMTLPYQEDTLDYLQNIIKLMQPGTRLIITVPNYRSFTTVLAFLKNDLRLGKLALAKSSQVNFYSKGALLRLMSSYNLVCKNILPYEYDNTHWVKRFINKINSLRFFTGKMLIAEAELKNG